MGAPRVIPNNTTDHQTKFLYYALNDDLNNSNQQWSLQIQLCYRKFSAILGFLTFTFFRVSGSSWVPECASIHAMERGTTLRH